MKKIKAIIFDAYGTLFDVNSAAEKCKEKLGDKWEGFANYWRTTQLEYTWLRSLMRRHKDFWQITEDSLDKSMNFYNIDNSMRSELLNLYKVLSPFTEVRDALKKLKQSNYKLAILSNGTPDLLNELVVSNQLKDIFDDIFSVEEAGIFKPDSKVYDLPINKYNIEKNEVLFLSANTWDVSGAGNYGYNTVWVNRNNNIFDNLDYKPNSEINDLKFFCRENVLKIVFLSRISKDKNLPFTYDILNRVTREVEFHIYGPVEDQDIWEDYKSKIKELPNNIRVIYNGSVGREEVKSTLIRYDILFLPTYRENFGHVIFESLSVGTPVLISQNTPWRNLEKKNIGWDLDLNSKVDFVNVLERYPEQSVESRRVRREQVIQGFWDSLDVSKTLQQNIELFRIS